MKHVLRNQARPDLVLEDDSQSILETLERVSEPPGNDLYTRESQFLKYS